MFTDYRESCAHYCPRDFKTTALLPPGDYLMDPLNDRVMKDVRPIPAYPLSAVRAFSSYKVDTRLLMAQIREGGKLSKPCVQ